MVAEAKEDAPSAVMRRTCRGFLCRQVGEWAGLVPAFGDRDKCRRFGLGPRPGLMDGPTSAQMV